MPAMTSGAGDAPSLPRAARAAELDSLALPQLAAR
jgi:hypothetical protein